MLQELAFTGQWRHYQKRVLDKSDAFMADGHLHLVAAPDYSGYLSGPTQRHEPSRRSIAS